MNMSEIKEAIKEIENAKGDPEVSHSLEDSLHEKFIEYISKGGAVAVTIKARLIMTIKDMDLERWYA